MSEHRQLHMVIRFTTARAAGETVATDLALRYPDRVRALVLRKAAALSGAFTTRSSSCSTAFATLRPPPRGSRA